jgi:uncharacterized protein
MAWGGKREGAGRKPNPNRPRFVAQTKVAPRPGPASVPAEPKTDVSSAIDPRAWVMMLPQIEEISRQYAVNKTRRDMPEQNPFRLPEFPKSALPPERLGTMAMDNALMSNLSSSANGWLAGESIGGLSGEGLLFLGYTYLSELAQRPEYRVMSETIADDATRRWIGFDVIGDEKKQKEDRDKDPAGYDERLADPDERKKRVAAANKTDRVKALEDDQLRLEVKIRYYEACRNGGFFGRTHLFHDIRTNAADNWEDPNLEELKTPIGNSRDATSKIKVPIGSFKELKTIEPIWCYPLMYNAMYPWRKDWYNPQVWYVMGQEIHGTRLQTFIPHPVPDMLKPAYAFGGLSLSQMAKPYVDRWLTTVTSVNQLIHSFSVMVLMTDLSTLMQPGNAGPLLARVAMFNMLRDNQGTFVVNKASEDFKNVSATLSGLSDLQAQSQEHMCAVNRIPLVKFTGITPHGLNASSESEIEVYDDTIAGYQARVLDPNLRRTINFEMLSLWGEIDSEITHRFEQLRPMTQKEKGEKEKHDAERHGLYVDMGAFDPAEIRKIAINDKELPYTGLDPDDVPELAAEVEEGGDPNDPPGGRPKKPAGEKIEEPGGGANDADLPFASDADFQESDHPRAPDGKFGSGGGSSSKPKPARLTPTEKAYLDSYSGDEFLKLNQKLRKGDTSAPAVAKLDSAIAKSTVAPGTKLYRGISKDALKAMIKGDMINSGQVLSDAGFLSTSTDRNIAGLNSIGGVLMEIEVGEGQHGLDMGQISRNQHEKEVVLPRDSKMKVLGLRAPKKPGDPIIVRVSTHNGGPFAHDATWEEGKHPRAPDGKFGSGGSSSAGGTEPKKSTPGIKAFGLEHAEKQKKEWRAEAPKTIADLVAGSPANQAALAAIAEKAAAAVGTKFKNPGVKSEKRLKEKIDAGRKAENITDAVRGGFDVKTPEDGDKIVHMLAQHFEIADEGWQKNGAGYFDRKTMVRFPDGQVGEIQMWPPGMLDAKETGGGHKIYEKWRTLPMDSTEAASLNDQMVTLYAAVEDALPAPWKSLFRKGG